MAEMQQPQPVVANIKYGGEYQDQLKEAQRTNQCIFCQTSFQEDRDKVLHREDGWFIRRNDYPTKDIDGENPHGHWLIVSERHLSPDPETLQDADFLAIARNFRWLAREASIPGGGFAIRFGIPQWSGQTIIHAHIHIIQPRIEWTGRLERRLDRLSDDLTRLMNWTKQLVRKLRRFPPLREPVTRYVNFPIG